MFFDIFNLHSSNTLFSKITPNLWRAVAYFIFKTLQNPSSMFIFGQKAYFLGPKHVVITKASMFVITKTFLFEGEHDYLRMLREAQRESNRSSSKVSPISSAFISVKTTPAGS